MILVTVGTHTAPFDPLVKAAEAFAEMVTEEVVIQRGVSRCVPRSARSFDFCTSVELAALMEASRVVVCHAADTVLDALRLERPVVAVTRLRQFGEHINDHQVDFAHALALAGWVHVLDDPMNLAVVIEAAASAPPPVPPANPGLANAIRRQILEWFPPDGPRNACPS